MIQGTVPEDRLPHAFAAIAVLFILQAEIWAYRMDPQEWSKRSYGGVYAAGEILAGEIAKILEPGETLYVFGDEPGFYFHTRTRPAVGTFFLADVAGGPLADELTGRTLKALARKPPDLVIIMNSSLGDKTVGPLNAKLGPEHPSGRGYRRTIAPLFRTRPSSSQSALDRVARLSVAIPTNHCAPNSRSNSFLSTRKTCIRLGFRLASKV